MTLLAQLLIKTKQTMERLMSSTKWDRVFVNQGIADAVRTIRDYMDKSEVSSQGKKTAPNIHHTVFPDGKVKVYQK